MGRSRLSPEGVVLAQLAALRRGDIHSAAQFTMAPPASTNGVFFMCMMAQHKLLNLQEVGRLAVMGLVKHMWVMAFAQPLPPPPSFYLGGGKSRFR